MRGLNCSRPAVPSALGGFARIACSGTGLPVPVHQTCRTLMKQLTSNCHPESREEDLTDTLSHQFFVRNSFANLPRD